MRRWLLLLLTVAVGCQASRVDVPRLIEGDVAAVAPMRATLDIAPSPAVGPADGPVDLASLWGLALANNPSLREAAADIEAAHGRWIQAGKYPNPRFVYVQDTIGSSLAPQGNISLQLNQEFVTAGKRRLDQAVAERETSVASVALVGRKFDVLTRVRRAYYDYLALLDAARLNDETVAALGQGLEIVRKQVETAKSRPRTDLLRLEALLEEARINQSRNRDFANGAWRQLAAEVGVPDLPVPEAPRDLGDAPRWDQDAVGRRVSTANTALKQAAGEVARARAVLDRARAEAVPNVVVGGGYVFDNIDETSGGQINVETFLPVWDRKQGRIREAQARWAQAQAAERTAANRLAHDTAEAFARYRAASRQVERLAKEVLPRLRESLELLRKAYQAGSGQVTFGDVLLTEQNLNTTRLTLAAARRSLWQAVADLEGLMQLDLGEPLEGPTPPCP